MKVYLSYSHRDRELAARIEGALRQSGVETLYERGLIPGEDLADALRQHIDQADVVLVVWTRAAVASHWLVEEATLAADQNKYLGVVAGQVELPLQFRRLHHLQITEGKAPDMAALGEELSRFEARSAVPRASNRTLKQAAKRRPQPAPSPMPSRSAHATQDVERAAEIDIPPFLRREPAPAVSAPSEAAATQAPPGMPSPDPFAAPATGGIAQAERYDAFISYSRVDEEACRLAFNLMVERGLVPWYDKDIGSGAFKSKIVTRISNASVFVLLLSRNSIASGNVSKELSVASSKDRLIIPISIDGTRPDDLSDTFRYELIELNIFKADPAKPESWSDVIDTIAESVTESGADAAIAPPVVAPAIPVEQLLARQPPPVLPPAKAQPPVLLGFLTVASALLQQGAVGYAAWVSGLASPVLAAALAIVAGVVIWPACYAALWLSRLALRPDPR